MLFPLFIIILIFMIVHRKRAEQNNQYSIAAPLPMQWFKFYTYFRIPLAVLYIIFVIPVQVIQAENQVVATITGTLGSITVVFFVFLFFGLHRRRLWGWKLNWIQLIFEVSVFSLSQFPDTTRVISNLIISLLCWFWPNALYFHKRRFMFKQFPETNNDNYNNFLYFAD